MIGEAYPGCERVLGHLWMDDPAQTSKPTCMWLLSLASLDWISVLLWSSASRELTFIYCESSSPVLGHPDGMASEKKKIWEYFRCFIPLVPGSLDIMFMIGYVTCSTSQVVQLLYDVCPPSDFYFTPSYWDKRNNKEFLLLVSKKSVLFC